MAETGARKALWTICLVLAPLVLIGIELFHPAGFTHEPGMYAYLSERQPYDPRYKALAYPGPEWWFTLHMIQTPMVALVAIGLWMLTAGLDRTGNAATRVATWLSRAATLVFLVYYTALDSIGGSGLGRTILVAQSLSDQGKLTEEQLGGVIDVLNTVWTDAWVGGVGSYISLTGSWAAFFAALFIAIALLIAAAVWIRWASRGRTTSPEPARHAA